MLGTQYNSNIVNNISDDGKPIRALCIHGHFYQPPREDPLTGRIPDELGAYPFHNWNERIHSECYRPNAELGNFERISFNVGPTLLKWMEVHDPVTYQRILAQDLSNVARFGVGNAMAQSYHHTILPLANRTDKETQIRWGIADFVHRFNRQPEGMWLPETAVDTETLEVLAENDIKFTVLAPWQADTEKLDPTQPYWINLPSGRQIVAFFYHGSLSGGVSFDQQLTSNAHSFALNDLTHHFNSNGRSQEPQMLLVASDGELYGHHQAFRDWFLAYLVNGAGAKAGIDWTYPALWLREHPPTQEMRIRESTSWSCHHGVERWQDDCGCLIEPGYWKKHLRQSFDNLAAKIDSFYQEAIQFYGLDPWELRNDYIRVHLRETDLHQLIKSHEIGDISADDFRKIDLLLQAQFNRERMYTSCAFFFEDFDRIEPKNNIAYGMQAIRLVYQALGINLFDSFQMDLSRVVSANSKLRGDQVLEALA